MTQTAETPPGLYVRMAPDDAAAVEARLEWARDQDLARRMWAKDHTLWGPEPEEISNRLGWLSIAGDMLAGLGELEAFVEGVGRDGFTDVALLGMGGSSLAPEVLRLSFGTAPGYLQLRVVDSTHPDEVGAVADELPLERTLFVVSSKSGGTLETRSLYAYFRSLVDEGSHFVAITDPGTSLEDLAAKGGFRHTFYGDPAIGGRYSALSAFGVVPAALMGIDVRELLGRAELAARAAQAAEPEDNAALWLGVAIGELARRGRDKLTFVTSEPVSSFGLWAEQLVAESTGKGGAGIVPVAGEPLGAPSSYGDDRVFAHIRNSARPDEELEARMDALAEAGHPVMTVAVRDAADLGGHFFSWEFAVAAAGAVLGINAFDQPNVQEAKDRATETIEAFKRDGSFPETSPDATGGPLAVYGDGSADSVAQALGDLIKEAGRGRYFATMAYLPPSDEADAALTRLRVAVRDAGRAATTVGYGPRFLHSTGQLHKGGPPSGVFLQVTAEGTRQIEIPGAGYGFGALVAAQALGDLEALHSRSLPALRVHIEGDTAAGLDALAREVETATESHTA